MKFSRRLAARMDEDHSSWLLNVLDDFSREGLGIRVDLSLPAERVVRMLNQIIEWRGKPLSISGSITAPNGSARH